MNTPDQETEQAARHIPLDDAPEGSLVRAVLVLRKTGSVWETVPTGASSVLGALVNRDGRELERLELCLIDDVSTELAQAALALGADAGTPTVDELAMNLSRSQPGAVLGVVAAPSGGWVVDPDSGRLREGSAEARALITRAMGPTLSEFARALEASGRAESPRELGDRPGLFLSGADAMTRAHEVLFLKLRCISSLARIVRQGAHGILRASDVRMRDIPDPQNALLAHHWLAAPVVTGAPRSETVHAAIGAALRVAPGTESVTIDDLRAEASASGVRVLSGAFSDAFTGVLIALSGEARTTVGATITDGGANITCDAEEASTIEQAVASGRPHECVLFRHAGPAGDLRGLGSLAADILLGSGDSHLLESVAHLATLSTFELSERLTSDVATASACGSHRVVGLPDSEGPGPLVPEELWSGTLQMLGQLLACQDGGEHQLTYDDAVERIGTLERSARSLVIPDARLRSEVAAALEQLA